jgi:hypothetical protein
MISGAMIYISNSIKFRSGIQNLLKEDSQAQTAWKTHKPSFIFLNKENRLKILKRMNRTITRRKIINFLEALCQEGTKHVPWKPGLNVKF